MNRSHSTRLLLLVVAAALAWGLYRLFELRFAGGDTYPPYSTYRADPLGTRALYEGFAMLSDRQPQRLLEDLKRLDSGRDTTLFLLGVNAEALEEVAESEAKDIEAFMEEGGRVVLTYYPVTTKPFSATWRERQASTNSPWERIRRGPLRKPETQPPEKNAGAKGDENRAPGAESNTNPVVAARSPGTNSPSSRNARLRDELKEEVGGIKTVSLRERWGFGVDYTRLEADENGVAEPVTVRRTNAPPQLPARLDWHSAAFFTPTNQAWHPLYARDAHPVFMERAFGRGSLVLATDSYFASNEALRNDRHTSLLAWLAGANQRLVFDETHLGVELQPGIATLARRYRLHGLFASLLLLAVLFVWRNSASFVPAHADAGASAEVVAGKDSAAGFVNLLRRSIAPRDLLAQCFAEWRKTGAHGRGDPSARLLVMTGVVEQQSQTPVDGYRELCRIVGKKNL